MKSPGSQFLERPQPRACISQGRPLPAETSGVLAESMESTPKLSYRSKARRWGRPERCATCPGRLPATLGGILGKRSRRRGVDSFQPQSFLRAILKKRPRS
jgi:hypothetical protein